MARKRKKKKGIVNDIVGLTTAGFTAGIGARALGGLNNQASTNAARGISNTTRFFPVAGTVLGGGLLLRQVRKLKKR